MRKNHLGRNLKLLRLWLGMRQPEFAEAVGISPTTVSNYERGYTITPEKLDEIEKKFNVDLSSIRVVYEAASGD